MALAKPVANPGSRGQDMRYSTQGLTNVGGGVYTDGVYHYDSNGLSLDRPNSPVSGLPPADASESYNVQTGQYSASGPLGGGGGGGGIPGAAVFAQTGAQGLAGYKKALARLNQNRQNTLTAYGYAADIDPETGVMKNQRVDSKNPFGIYQTYRRNNALQYLQLRDAASERHLGGRGLGAQGISDARFGWGAADTAMAQQLTQTESGYDQEQQGAWQTYQNLLWQLELEAARAAAANASYGYPYDDGGGDGGDSPPDEYQGSGQLDYTPPLIPSQGNLANLRKIRVVAPKPKPKPKPKTISPTKRVSRG